MTEHLEQLHDADGYEFNATEACICCMPHTMHLSALDDDSDPPVAPEEHEVVLQEVTSAVGKVGNHYLCSIMTDSCSCSCEKLFELYGQVPKGGRPGCQKPQSLLAEQILLRLEPHSCSS